MSTSTNSDTLINSSTLTTPGATKTKEPRAKTPRRNRKKKPSGQSTKKTTRPRSKSPSVRGLALQAEETKKGWTDTTAAQAADLARRQTQITLDDRVRGLVDSVDGLPQNSHTYGPLGMSEGDIASRTKKDYDNNSFLSKKRAESLNTFQTPKDEAQEAKEKQQQKEKENQQKAKERKVVREKRRGSSCPEWPCGIMGGKKRKRKTKRRRKTRRRTKRRVKKHRKRKTRKRKK